MKDTTFLKECIKSTSTLFSKEDESDTAKCNLFKCELLELEKEVPSFYTNQELKNVALNYRDQPWYLIIIIEKCIRYFCEQWDKVDLEEIEEIEKLIEKTCPHWFSDPKSSKTYTRLKKYEGKNLIARLLALVIEANNQFVPILNKFQKWSNFTDSHQKFFSHLMSTKKTILRDCMSYSKDEFKTFHKTLDELDKELMSIKNKFMDCASINIEKVPLFTDLNTDIKIDFDILERNVRKLEIEKCMFQTIELQEINKMIDENTGEQEVRWIKRIEEQVLQFANVVKEAKEKSEKKK